MNATELLQLSLESPRRAIRRWWLRRLEQHYLVCAEVEQQLAKEAQANVAYFQKRAAIARSAQLD